MRLTPRQYAEHLRSVPVRLREEARKAEEESVAETLKEAIRLSSGPHSLSELRKAGHPYSVRAPQPGLFPAFILNEQKGDFLAAWDSEEPRDAGNKLVSRVFNSDPKGGLFSGTPLMVPRLVQEAAVGIVAPARRRRLEEAVPRAHGRVA